ncbi:MAG: nucleoside triphosphate pyrophosphohydrolase [Candidatus Altiarchaeota archaeon]|nr:nucleoside triphosphate pyrophosphohydrolase [Candidatus Altiarchaeota archaeon]
MAVIDIILSGARFQPKARVFHTPSKRGRFTIDSIDKNYIRIRTRGGNVLRIASRCFDDAASFLSGKEGVPIGARHGKPERGSFDWFVQTYTGGVSAASYVAPILEEARIAEINRGRPNRIRLIERFDKLVRDKAPEAISSGGSTPLYHKAAGREYWKALSRRIAWDAEKLAKQGDIDRLADLLELIYAAAEKEGISVKELEEHRRKRRKEHGGFDEGMVLEEVVL